MSAGRRFRLVVGASAMLGVLADDALGDKLVSRKCLNGRILISAIAATATAPLECAGLAATPRTSAFRNELDHRLVWLAAPVPTKMKAAQKREEIL